MTGFGQLRADFRIQNNDLNAEGFEILNEGREVAHSVLASENDGAEF